MRTTSMLIRLTRRSRSTPSGAAGLPRGCPHRLGWLLVALILGFGTPVPLVAKERGPSFDREEVIVRATPRTLTTADGRTLVLAPGWRLLDPDRLGFHPGPRQQTRVRVDLRFVTAEGGRWLGGNTVVTAVQVIGKTRLSP